MTKTAAFGYLRTSSAANVDGDSHHRQLAKIHQYAITNGIEVAAEFYDPAVSGADLVESRPGFAAMLVKIVTSGIRLVIVEDATRFAREMLAQESGIATLQKLGVVLVTASGENLTDTTDPHRVAMRQMQGVFSQLEKARLVAKLKHARDAKSAAIGRRCEGRRSFADRDAVLIELRTAHPKAKQAELSQMLAERGFFTTSIKGASGGKPLSVQAISVALARLQAAA
jgi:DNA invertase Pin-like site-specific DNA recombinase